MPQAETSDAMKNSMYTIADALTEGPVKHFPETF
jgi:hypothetical protein